MKIRTSSELMAALDKELSWRRLELSSLYLLMQSAQGNEKSALIRSLVVMLYAHWEGFIKSSSEIFINYINRQYIKHCDVKNNFAAASLKNIINSLRDTNKYSLITKLYAQVIESGENTVEISATVETKSNLKKEIFEEIIHLLGFSFDRYDTSLNFINSLVNDRNSIAHGEFLPINESKYKEMEEKTLSIMEMFKEDIQNSCTARSFKKES